MLIRNKIKLPAATFWLLGSMGILMFFASTHSHNSLADPVQTQTNGRILIASQRTEFQEEVTRLVTDHYKVRSFFTQLIGFNNLRTVKEAEWSAIVVLQSWDGAAPPSEITNLMKAANPKEKVIVVTSSESGHEKLTGVDAITAASLKSAAPDAAKKIITRIDKVVKQ